MAPAAVLALPKRRRVNLVLRDGIWIFRKTIDGKRYRVSTGCRDYKLAESRAAQIEGDILKSSFGWKKKAVPTVAAFVETYLAAKSATWSSPSTPIRLLRRFAAFPDVARLPLDEVTRTHCDMFLNQERSKYAPNSVRTTHSHLATMFNYAIEARVITTANPWHFKMTKRVSGERVMEADEHQALAQRLLPMDQRYVIVEVATGLRRAEMANLIDTHLDFRLKRIRVMGKGAKLRYVPMSPIAEAVLREQITERDAGRLGLTDRKTLRARIKAKHVFPYAPATVYQHIVEAARAAGLQALTVHDLRRTFATRCAEENVPMKRLQSWLGHGSITTTAETYVHLSDRNDQALLVGVSARAAVPVVPKQEATKLATSTKKRRIA